MDYFKKELFSNTLRLGNGRTVPFQLVGEDTGILATEDSGLISELDKVVARRRGGVSKLTPEAFEDLKKNPPVKRSLSRSLNAQSLQQLFQDRQKNGAIAEVAKPSEPLNVPEPGVLTVSSMNILRQKRAAAAAQKAAAEARPGAEAKPT